MKYAGVAKKLQVNHPRAFQIWSPEEEDKLAELVKQGKNVLEISREIGRHPSSINKRIDLLGLKEKPKPEPKPEIAPNDTTYLDAAPAGYRPKGSL